MMCSIEDLGKLEAQEQRSYYYYHRREEPARIQNFNRACFIRHAPWILIVTGLLALNVVQASFYAHSSRRLLS